MLTRLMIAGLLASITTSVSAFPQFIPPSQIPGAVRSPCPGLNSLANHGFLPRDGKNISLPVLFAACQGAPPFTRTYIVRLMPSPFKRGTQRRRGFLRGRRRAWAHFAGRTRKGWPCV
jgi:hypothetical protein